MTRREFVAAAVAAGVTPGWLAAVLGRAEAGELPNFGIPLADVTPYSGGMKGGWWRGNMHVHSYRSDGKAFPTEVAALYRREGMHFLGLSDHNVAQEDKHVSPVMKWGMRPDFLIPAGKLPKDKVARFEATFPELKPIRVKNAEGEFFRLRTFDEMAKLLDEKGRFLLLSGNELTFTGYADNFHANVINTRGDCLAKTGHQTPGDAVDDLIAQARKLVGTDPLDSIFTLNHPHWLWFDVPPDLAVERPGIRFFEVSNTSSGNMLPPPEKALTIDRWWDVVNTRRALAGQPLIYGMGSDDTHDYDPFYIRKGLRMSYCVVRAPELSRKALFEAMYRGDFYASTGVTLDEVRFDAAARTLFVKVAPKAGETYVIRFVGSRKGVNANPVETYEVKPPESWLKTNKGYRGRIWRGKKTRRVDVYAPELGMTFKETEGTDASYTMTADDLYVRAKVFVKNPEGLEEVTPPRVPVAWTQPVLNR